MTPRDTTRPVVRALLSVYDKSGLVEFGRGLAELGVELVASVARDDIVLADVLHEDLAG